MVYRYAQKVLVDFLFTSTGMYGRARRSVIFIFFEDTLMEGRVRVAVSDLYQATKTEPSLMTSTQDYKPWKR